MLPLLLIFPWSLLLLALWKQSKASSDERTGYDRRSGGYGRQHYEGRHPAHRAGARRDLFDGPVQESFTTADYLHHLHEATAAARILDTVKPLALQANVTALMHAPSEVLAAIKALGAPMDTIFVQKDLNVLGASPPLTESGTVDKQTTAAVQGFQHQFNLEPTGYVDWETAIALRYSVGCIYSQDRAAANGG